jgi:biopolymer transport protein ExbB/TolQ
MLFRIFGAVLWLLSAACALAAFATWGRMPYIGPMLQPGVKSNPAPVFILLLFTWVLIEILVRAFKVLEEQTAAEKFQSLPGKASYESAAHVARGGDGTRAAKRGRIVAEGSSDPAGLSETLPSITSLDAAALASRYVPLQVYAWILPVIGFIGTAAGMAHSIQGFKDTLASVGGAESFDAITQKLGETVIPGMAAAFGTTILALVASVVAYLCTSALKEWDQEVLQRLDYKSVAYLAAVPASVVDESILAEVKKHSAQVASIDGKLGDIKKVPEDLIKAAGAITAASAVLQLAAAELLEASKRPIIAEIRRGQP